MSQTTVYIVSHTYGDDGYTAVDLTEAVYLDDELAKRHAAATGCEVQPMTIRSELPEEVAAGLSCWRVRLYGGVDGFDAATSNASCCSPTEWSVHANNWIKHSDADVRFFFVVWAPSEAEAIALAAKIKADNREDIVSHTYGYFGSEVVRSDQYRPRSQP